MGSLQTYKGFVNSEDENVIAKMPTVACEAHKTSDVGVYNIGFTSEGEAANYSFVYESGVLTIEKATQEIIWEQEFSNTIAIGTQIEINAEATSGLDLEFSIDNEKVAVIYQAAGKYYIDCCGAGVVNIKAIQAGNKNYHSAVRVSKLLTVFAPTGIEQLTIDNGQLTMPRKTLSLRGSKTRGNLCFRFRRPQEIATTSLRTGLAMTEKS